MEQEINVQEVLYVETKQETRIEAKIKTLKVKINLFFTSIFKKKSSQNLEVELILLLLFDILLKLESRTRIGRSFFRAKR